MFTNLNAKAAAGPKQEKKAPSAQQQELAKLQRARVAVLRKVEETGTKPESPSNFFVPHNKDFYNCRATQVVPCSLEPGNLDLEAGAAARNTAKRRLHVINCGKPVAKNQDAGKVLHGTWKTNDDGVLECTPWPFSLLPTEEYAVTYTDPLVQGKPGRDGRVPDPVPDPSRVPDPTKDFVLSETPTYSDADVAGRYGGFKALCTAATTAWTTLVLGFDVDYTTGKPTTAMVPVSEGEDETSPANDALWDAQQVKVKEAFSKLFLVYPNEVDPCFGPEGEVYPLGEVAKAEAEDRDPVPLCSNMTDDAEKALHAPQPVQFVTLRSDRREGKPGLNIGGFHDKTRAWPLPPGHVEQMRKILQHYQLEDAFPALAKLHPKRNSAMLDLEVHRLRFEQELGDPPERPCNREQPVCQQWLKKRSELPFGKVWVQKCDEEHPSGCVVHGTDTPWLVPLRKNRAEDKNGVPWLDVEKIDRSTPEGEQHYVDVQTMLHRIVGKAWNKSGASTGGKRKARGDGAAAPPQGEAADPRDPDGSMLKSLNSATDEAARLRKRNEELVADLAESRMAVKKLKMEAPHMVLDRTRESRGIVDFVHGRDAKCILRWPSAKCLIELADGKTISVPVDTNSLTVRYLASEEQDLPALPMLEDHSGGGGGADNADDDDEDM